MTQIVEASPSPNLRDPRDALLDDASAFIRLLAELKDSERGRLSALKRNAGEVLPGRGVSWFPSLLRTGHAHRHAETFFLVATLYDFNRAAPITGDFGRALRKLADASGSNGVGRRVHILLDAEFDRIYDPFDSQARVQSGGGELAFRLRQMVKLCASKSVGVDWPHLLADLCRWDWTGKPVQKKWARSFFGQSPEVRTNAESADTTDTEHPNASS